MESLLAKFADGGTYHANHTLHELYLVADVISRPNPTAKMFTVICVQIITFLAQTRISTFYRILAAVH